MRLFERECRLSDRKIRRRGHRNYTTLDLWPGYQIIPVEPYGFQIAASKHKGVEWLDIYKDYKDTALNYNMSSIEIE